ncbi:integrase [Allocatelliglobosispora scoriae]|uniref:Integrase n=1 Tax=Allocatelliglobosispora scoriae TaxID=643052 RepID=A0A841BQQ1_9ACTN|nr:tyrosine-type recombinase/integrase [Allocatelliglobosispora scoriae]MBB5870574.1 integrase [Allocatelliglobosispora scoriae]
MKSYSVRVWAIKVNKLAKGRKSYTVRWIVAHEEQSATFATRSLADNYRTDLKKAVNAGEAFDTVTGLPDSMVELALAPVGETWMDFAARYVAMKWPDAAAKSRSSMIDALITVTPALVVDDAGCPEADVLRRVLAAHFIPSAKPDACDLGVLAWVVERSVPLSSLADAVVTRAGLEAVGRLMDGKAAAATTRRRKRAVFYNVLEFAVELELLDSNPIDRLRVRTRKTSVVEAVDSRVVANPRQMTALLIAVGFVGDRIADRGKLLVAFFACLYYAALRPGEALGLRQQDCHLPQAGWGKLTVGHNRPEAGKKFTDSGEVHDRRGLKHRDEREVRGVPIPPVLVLLLRAHIELFGAADDGRLFRSANGRPVASSTYRRVWKQAREIALTPEQASSVLAETPYDLRHAGVSLWLNSGVPAPNVASRAGHSVEVLLKIYAKCIHGEDETINGRIERGLEDQSE